MKLVLVAAIASTISSVIGYRIAKVASNSKEGWVNRIRDYNLCDVLAVVLVLVIIVRECVIMNPYFLEIPRDFVYPIIIIVGLGWGLLIQIIHQYRERKSMEREKALLEACK
ncbi:MAG: hypothetical protein WAK17_16210 [Candidatus Nitrosopolaris sp.]